MGSLQGKRALITGAGGAIGKAAALLFAREGAKVAAVDIALDAAEAAVAEINAMEGRAWAIPADVADEASAERAVARAAELMGGVDILFNNAGIMPHEDRSFEDAEAAQWDRILGVNLRGTVHFSKYATPHILAAGGGAIVNMSSFLAVLGCSYPQDAYTASKGAIAALTRSMAVQLGPHGVRVNALAPGPILTAHVEKFFPDEEARRIRLARYPLGRFGSTTDVAELACFLASERSAWITGQVIVLDGGASCNYL